MGFMSGQIKVPADFDRMYADEIIALFEGDDVPAITEVEALGEGGTA